MERKKYRNFYVKPLPQKTVSDQKGGESSNLGSFFFPVFGDLNEHLLPNENIDCFHFLKLFMPLLILICDICIIATAMGICPSSFAVELPLRLLSVLWRATGTTLAARLK